MTEKEQIFVGKRKSREETREMGGESEGGRCISTDLPVQYDTCFYIALQ